MGLRRRTIGGCACLLLLCCAALAAIGCGPSGGGGGQTTTGGATKGATTVAQATKGATTTAETPIATIQVNETEMSLDPSDITLDRPGTYVFRATNVGNVTHALRIEGNGVDQSTRNIEPGESAEMQVNLGAGSYEIDCPVDDHEDQGMRGTLTVKEA
jgi:uncharacterized cupredoxin-like copper-binding protein